MAIEIWHQRKLNWCKTPFTFTTYTLRDSDLIISSGVLTKRKNNVKLYRITDVSTERSLIQRIFGLTTIIVDAMDKSSGGQVRLINIADGERVADMISDYAEQARRAYRVRPTEFVSEGPIGGVDSDIDSGSDLDMNIDYEL